MGSSTWTWGRTSSLWGWRSTGTACPGRLWSLLLWRYSRPAWTRSCAACCRWTCFGRGFGLDDPQRSLPTPNILWFCLESQHRDWTSRDRGPDGLTPGKQTGDLGNLLENSWITGGRWFNSHDFRRNPMHWTVKIWINKYLLVFLCWGKTLIFVCRGIIPWGTDSRWRGRNRNELVPLPLLLWIPILSQTILMSEAQTWSDLVEHPETKL